MSDRIYIEPMTREEAEALWAIPEPGWTGAQCVARAEALKKVSRALASEESPARWACDACHDEGTVLGVIATTPNGDEMGEVPCPDCSPESVEGEDRRWTIFVCPECGEQVPRRPDGGSPTHFHPQGGRTFIATPTVVIPAPEESGESCICNGRGWFMGRHNEKSTCSVCGGTGLIPSSRGPLDCPDCED